MRACQRAAERDNMFPAGSRHPHLHFTGSLPVLIGCIAGYLVVPASIKGWKDSGLRDKLGRSGKEHVDRLCTNLGEEETQTLTLQTGCCCRPEIPEQREGKKNNCRYCNTGEHFLCMLR